MTRNTQPGQLRSGSVKSISRSRSGVAAVSRPELNRKSLEGAESPYCPATAPKPEGYGEGLYGGVGQNPCCIVCKPGQELQETCDLCNCKQRFLYQILSSAFRMYQILMSCNKMLINYWKIIQCDILDFCFRFCHSQLKSTYDKKIDFYMICKWENLQNR